MPALPPRAFIEPCLPRPAKVVPRGPQWVHEIKHDQGETLVCFQGIPDGL